MATLIINADDFGYSRGVNHGIIDAHKYGVVNSTTLMMNMPGTEHAMELAKRHPHLNVGIHLVLTCGRPLLTSHKTIVNEEGRFHRNPEEVWKRDIDVNEIEMEWTAQIERFLSFGRKPGHIDSHHHAHTYAPLRDVMERLAQKYGLLVRSYPELPNAKRFSDVLYTHFFAEGVSHKTLDDIVEASKADEVVEVMVHPGYVDTVLLEGSSYNIVRLKELDVLTTWLLPDKAILKSF